MLPHQSPARSRIRQRNSDVLSWKKQMRRRLNVFCVGVPLVSLVWSLATAIRSPSIDPPRPSLLDRGNNNPVEERGVKEKEVLTAVDVVVGEKRVLVEEDSFATFHELPPGNRSAGGDFLTWCQTALGIETILEIDMFEYDDFMHVSWLTKDDATDDEWKPSSPSVPSIEADLLPKRSVRGLAASRDIASGETVIRVPLPALWSVTTLIDQDPELRRFLGPTARIHYGWNMEEEDSLIEIPLLAVSLLYHQALGAASPLASYLDSLLASPIDPLPYLWNGTQLALLPEGVRKVARGMRRDMRMSYDTIVLTLVRAHPTIFGKKPENGTEYMYSYVRFQWAFAMVHSRHWQLPMEVFGGAVAKPVKQHPPVKAPLLQPIDEEQQGAPPADMPTDEWVTEHEGDVDDIVMVDTKVANPQATPELRQLEPRAHRVHSFLAPVADLLNFGPPCTQGIYNVTTNTFDIVATCSFRKGQEVTFWYADECSDVMMGLYGFEHPMIPPCPTADDYRQQVENWRERAQALQGELDTAYEDLDEMDAEVDHLYDVLSDCECCRFDDEKPSRKTRLRHEHVRGGTAASSLPDDSDLQRNHNKRKLWRDRREARKSEF